MATIYFHTIGNMEKVESDGISSEASGHDQEDGLDHNLDTWWAPTNTAVNACEFDFQEAKTVDGLGLWVHNYDTDIGVEQAEISYSTDGSSYTIVDAWQILASAGALGTPMKLFPTISESAYRYWRCTFGSTITQVIEISQWFFWRRYTVTVAGSLPWLDEDIFHNRVADLGGGRIMVTGTARDKTQTFTRTYEYLSSTDFTALQNAFEDCKGSRFPFINQEDGSTNHLVRFDQDILVANQVANGLYSPTVRFRTVPYIRDGETF